MKAKTKDELFIMRAYECTLQADDLSIIQNRYEVGKSCGISEKGVDAICNLLAQANFIKKIGKTDMILTKNGENLALRLLTE